MFSNYKTTRNLLYIQEFDFPPNESRYIENSCENSSFILSKYLILLDVYYIPVIVITGFLGNILSCLVLLCTQLKLRSSSYYLAALSLSDSGYLFCLFCFSKNVFNLYNKQGFCQIFIYLTYVFSFISVWLIVAFTVERFIAVQYPLKKPYICTSNRAKKIVIGLSSVGFLLYVFTFWITDVIEDECQLNPKYGDFMEVFNYVDTAGTLIIPVIMIVGMNAMIARSLFKLKKYMQRRLADDHNTKEFELCHTSSSQSNSSSKKSKEVQEPVTAASFSAKKVTFSRRVIRTQKFTKIYSKKRIRHATSCSHHSINRMLLIISSVFIALNFPSYLVRLCVHFEAIIEIQFFRRYFECLQQFAMILYYTNFSVNFLLYTMCGKAFRMCLKTFVCDAIKKMFCFPNRTLNSQL